MKRQSIEGFSMIEMLIALVILSIGLLGVAALQMKGQQYNTAAYSRTQAAFLAYDLMDRIRANTGGLNPIVVGSARNATYDVGTTAPANKGVDCDVNTCSPAQLAQYDLFVWFSLIRKTLPQGAGRVACVPVGANPCTMYDISISWLEDRDPTAPPLKTQIWRIVL